MWPPNVGLRRVEIAALESDLPCDFGLPSANMRQLPTCIESARAVISRDYSPAARFAVSAVLKGRHRSTALEKSSPAAPAKLTVRESRSKHSRYSD